jgi:hypothetical protein
MIDVTGMIDDKVIITKPKEFSVRMERKSQKSEELYFVILLNYTK